MKAGKVRKQEEKRRKLAAEKEAKEKEAKLVAQRAELEAAKERERQLQLQLESLDDEDSSDEDGPQEVTPQETTPTNSVVLPKEASQSTIIPAAVLAASPSPQPQQSGTGPNQNMSINSNTTSAVASAYSSETKNPFFKKLSQSGDRSLPAASQSKTSFASPTTAEASTNPFHRLTLQENAAKSAPPLSSTPTSNRPSRIRPEEDEWSVVDSTEDSSDDDDEGERSTGGSAKQLASMLFGTMAPPRPLSAMDEKKSPSTNADATMTPSMSPSTPMMSAGDALVPPPPPSPMPMPIQAPSSIPDGPPPPPPMPGSFGGAPSAPPPPAPPMQPAPTTGSGPPSVGALLGDIKKGKGLKKVETKDRSQASVAGRVLS